MKHLDCKETAPTGWNLNGMHMYVLIWITSFECHD